MSDGSTAYWVTFLDGLQRVVLFTEIDYIAHNAETSTYLQHINQEIEIRIHGIGLSVVNNETGVDIIYMGVISSGIIWESKKLNKKRFKQMNMAETDAIELSYQQYLLDKAVNNVGKYYFSQKYEV